MKIIPGDPLTEEKAIPKEILEQLQELYGFNEPIYTQYFNYLSSIFKGDLGPSFKFKSLSVNSIIKSGFPISAILGVEALFIAIFFGVLLGSIAALKQNQWQDSITTLIAIMGISIPSFILATFLQYLFAIKFPLFPVARFQSFSHSVLPALSLSALPTAFIARLTRSSLLEVMQQDYIQTAYAKGLSTSKVLIKHALRNALLPILTYMGPLITNIFVGSFVVENIFGIPGLGQWFVKSVMNRDYTVIMGTTIFYSSILLTTTFIIDLLYSILDPRIQTP